MLRCCLNRLCAGFLCALGGVRHLTTCTSRYNESLDRRIWHWCRRFYGDGKPQAFYQVVNGIAVLPVTRYWFINSAGMRPFSGMTGYDGVAAGIRAVSDPGKSILLDIDSPAVRLPGRLTVLTPFTGCANETCRALASKQ
ncbi:hypothetical protein KCP69_13875 [Salmonella enterica subsp. enterica]|nr:hypothetical protein KCP69_13875 [Salmonella enterica subsp. enterica]